MRRLMVFGGTSGIGEEVFLRLRQRTEFAYASAYGYENFNLKYSSPLRRAIKDRGPAPTDVVFSVGINKLDWIRDVNLEDFWDMMEANVWTFLNLVQTLDRNVDGPINMVAITSDAAWRPMRTSAGYCASKAALEMAVRVASREYAPKGWRINAVAPGKVAETPMTDYVDAKVLELRGWTVEAAEAYELQSTPLGRKVTKGEVAEVVEQVLFGPAAQTGEIIAVNGGR